MLNEETPIADAALPVAQFKAHLRLGSGFGEDDVQDPVLTGFLRAAIATIEARTGKALIRRVFTLKQSDWSDAGGETLPIAPVASVDAVDLIDMQGNETPVDAGRFWLEPDAQAPRLRPVGSSLPGVPANGQLRVTLTAGMADDWGGLPADLGQAVMLLAAHYYEYRDETALGTGCMPFGVTSLIQRYRPVRLTLGAAQ